jgi:hypothetical protein
MSFFGEQLERGYSWLVAIEIEGIPALWVEREALRFDTDLVASNAADKPAEPALVITESSKLQWTLDRQTGVASGRAFDIDLDLNRMSLTARALFRRPGRRSRLTADVFSPSTTTIDVADTSVWPSSGRFWLGRECCDYTGKTSTAFTGVTRAVAGLPHAHISNTASGYAFATDRPIYWRGRFVTIHLHLVTPDGRLMATEWLGGDYTRVVWRGFIDAQPEIRGGKVLLRALPLERRLTQGLGSEAEATFTDLYEFGTSIVGVWVEPSDKLLIIKESNGDTAQVPFNASGHYSPQGWGDRAMADAQSFFGGSWRGSVSVRGVGNNAFQPPFRFLVYLPTGYRVESRCWFVGDMTPASNSRNGYVGLMDFSTMSRPWLFINTGLDVVGRPAAWPATGFGLATVDGKEEIIAWDRVEFLNDGQYVIRVTQRALAGSQRLDLWVNQGTLKSITGGIGTFSEVARTLLTSSGTGARGPYDTLAIGSGYGIPDEWLEFNDYPWTTTNVEALGEAGTSFEELMGGWLALYQTCAVQDYRHGALKIRPISTSMVDGAGLPLLDDASIILGTVEAQGLVESPNAIVIDQSVLSTQASLAIRDVPRVQAEDWRKWEMTAPSIPEQTAVGLAIDLMALSDGQQAVKAGVRPNYRPGIGALVRITAEHPEIYDWNTGDIATDALARVVDFEWSLYDGERNMVHLLAGQARDIWPLCPSAQITARPSTTEVEIGIEHVTGFAAGYYLRIYIAGNESNFMMQRQIVSVVQTSTTATLTLDSALSTSDYGVGAWITYDDAGGTVEQARHLFYMFGEFR